MRCGVSQNTECGNVRASIFHCSIQTIHDTPETREDEYKQHSCRLPSQKGEYLLCQLLIPSCYPVLFASVNGHYVDNLIADAQLQKQESYLVGKKYISVKDS